MNGPGAPKGAYTNHGVGHRWRHLECGKRYRVIKPFFDFDRQEHTIGEEWIYLGTAFLPYDDGRSIFVSMDGEHEWHIRMQGRPEEQGSIIDNLHEYVAPA